MKTTQLFADLFIIGTQVVIWLSLLVASIFERDLAFLFNRLYEGNTFKIFISTVIILACYVLGILFDEAWEQLLYKVSGWFKKGKAQEQKKVKQEIDEDWSKEAYVFARSASGTMQLNYMRGRYRIVRGSMFNMGLIILSSILYIWRVPEVGLREGLTVSITIVIFGIVILALSRFVFLSLKEAYWLRVRGIYKALKEDSSCTTAGS